MKLIILDRDGVISHDSEEYIKSPEEWHPIAGSLEAIAHLTKAGYTIAVATNQSGVAREYYTLATLEKIHEKLLAAVTTAGGKIDKIVYCPHKPDDHCECRKPKPGMLLQIAKHYNSDLKNVFFIGDGLRDVDAARAAGCTPILVRTGYGVQTETRHATELQGVKIFDDLASFVRELLQHRV